MHLVDAFDAEYKPTPQASHFVEPLFAAKVPGAHGTWLIASGDQCPAATSEQLCPPVVCANCPCEHFVHPDEQVVGAYVPLAHATSAVRAELA